ncbi:MAG: N-acetyltransferase [Ignavibacteriales bacterium]|nr:N-acetyltransferase [Ignavibacteriales bacterium]
MMEYNSKKVSVKNVEFGENVTVVEPANIYECSIGDNTFIGPFTEIQRGVKVGKNCKIQSHAFVCELVKISDGCFISHGAMFINDVFTSGGPAGGDKTKWKKTYIGKNVSIGTNATILPVNICDNVVIGAGSVVTKNINIPGIYTGNPARLLRKF